MPDFSFDNHPPIDIFVIPGGVGTKVVMNKEEVLGWMDKRFIDSGKIMTSGGISAGIDLALHIVTKIYGETIVNKSIRYMEYGDWRSL